MSWSSSERRWWSLAALYTLTIYAAAYYVQFVLTALFERGWLVNTLAAFFLLVGVTLGIVAVRHGSSWRELWLLPAAALPYGWLWVELEVIQERVHLVQYGVLAALLLLALEARRRRLGRGHPYRHAFWLNALAGWGDEGVQAILPNRTYDLRDVVLNAVSGGLLLTMIWLRRRLRGDETETSEPSQAVDLP